MDYDLDRKEVRKACQEIKMREKLYQQNLTPYVEKLKEMFGIDQRSCIDCKYSYIEDLYNELCCENEKHRIEEATGLAENDPISPETSKPCCRYYEEEK